jgi:hypothetical protein
VVGDGTPASCTEAALRAAMASDGTVTFNCGASPAAITIGSQIEVRANVTLDGENRITLQGGGGRIFFHRSFDRSSSALTLRNLTLTGGSASGSQTQANGAAILSVNNSFDGRTFPQTLTLENVSVINNDSRLTAFDAGVGQNAYDFGGAIYSQGGVLVVRGSTFRDNDANNGAGGALHVLQSTLLVENSNFANNSAIGAEPRNSQGGAIYIDGVNTPQGGFARILGSTFTNNRAFNSGGAIYVNMYENSNQFVVERSSFTNNAVTGGNGALGGAISGGSSTLGANSGNASINISASTFSGNSVRRSGSPTDGSGGALAFAQRARISIVNSTFAGNRAEGSGFNANGGALYVVNNSDQFQVINSTFANNFAGWVGGAISNSQVNDGPGGLVQNTLFFNNTADNGPNDWNIQQHCSSELAGSNNIQFPGRLTGGNFFNDVTCFVGKSAPSQTNLPDFRDPRLAALADNGGPTQTMAIGSDSPAFNGGNPTTCPATDQRGIARPQGERCDIGAFELVLRLSVSPALLQVNQQNVTLTVTGAGFSNSSQVLVNGQPRETTFVSATSLRARLAAADLASAGELSVSVSDSSLPPAAVRVVTELRLVFLPLVRR